MGLGNVIAHYRFTAKAKMQRSTLDAKTQNKVEK